MVQLFLFKHMRKDKFPIETIYILDHRMSSFGVTIKNNNLGINHVIDHLDRLGTYFFLFIQLSLKNST